MSSILALKRCRGWRRGLVPDLFCEVARWGLQWEEDWLPGAELRVCAVRLSMYSATDSNVKMELLKPTALCLSAL